MPYDEFIADPKIVEEMKSVVANGGSIVQVVEAILDGLGRKNAGFVAVDTYLCVVFGIPLSVVRQVEGLSCLGGGMPDEKVNELLMPLLRDRLRSENSEEAPQ